MGALHTEEYSYVIDILNALLRQSMRWKQADLHLEAAKVARLHHLQNFQSLKTRGQRDLS